MNRKHVPGALLFVVSLAFAAWILVLTGAAGARETAPRAGRAAVPEVSPR